MKKILALSLTLILALDVMACSNATASSNTNSSANVATAIVSDFTTSRYFTNEAVTESAIEEILNAGINTASASNKQPWHFAAVANKDVLQSIEDAVNRRREANGQAPLAKPEAGKAVDTSIANVPLLIVVSAEDGAEINAGLATQNMAIMAQLLGYGTKIETSPATAINDNIATFGEVLGIPENQKAKTIIKIGKVDTSINETVDGFTSATTRNAFDEMAKLVK